MLRKQQIKEAMVNHVAKTGRCPEWKSIGVDVRNGEFDLGRECWRELFKEGILESYNRVSPKGRNMKAVRVVQK